MGLMRTVLVCALLVCLVFNNFICCCNTENTAAATSAVRGALSESRGMHRLKLLFPLLLRISSRLATLVPTALMGLLGIFLFVVFSKKALIVSFFALFLILLDKFKFKNDNFYIHKVNSYSDYNDEEHIHYHHGPSRYKTHYCEKTLPSNKWEKNIKKTVPSLLRAPYTIPLQDDVHSFKPIPVI